MSDLILPVPQKFVYPQTKLVLSHSLRSSFRRCTRLLEFNKLYGDGGGREDTFPAECGKALHAGFQEYLINKDETRAVFEMMKAYPYELEFLKPENKSRSLEACYVTLENMISSPIPDTFELIYVKGQDGATKPAIEVPFAIEILNSPLPIPVYFVGFVDAILYSKVEQEYLVNDIKTTRMNITDYSTRYEYDEQTVPYGIILEHILKTAINQFRVSYLSVYIDLIEPKTSMYKFTKTQEHIHDWFRGLCEDIWRINQYYRGQFFPRATNGETCFSFNRACYHSDTCAHRDPEIINRLIGSQPREGLFHDGKEPWIVAQLEWINPYASND